MSLEIIFSISTIGVMPIWLLLIVAPEWKWTGYITNYIWVPVLIGLLYLTLLAISIINQNLISSEDVRSMMDVKNLADLTQFFSNPIVVLVGWIHFVVFDLFIGIWIVNDSRKVKMNHLFIVPCLILTFYVGPIGLLLYLILRLIMFKSIRINQISNESAIGLR